MEKNKEPSATEMTVQQIVDDWCTMDADTKIWAGDRIFNKLCPVSQKTLLEFQRGWDRTQPFEVFQKAQQDELHKCVTLEVTELGKATRKATGMTAEFDWDTVIKEKDDDR